MATGIIRTAIYNKYVANTSLPLYIDIGTKFYYDEADKEVVAPYCVFHIFDEIYDFTFDLEFEECLVQFDYYGKTANECDDGVIDIKALFDYAALSITGYTFLKLERQLVIPASKVEPDDLWVGVVRYELLMKKT